MVGKIVPPHVKEFDKITNLGTGGRGQLSGNSL